MMWSPTHVQVTVQKAWGLLTKGKHNTNDCFVTIALGKVKYQTSVKEKSTSSVEWHEECELPIPDQGNVAEIILTVLHRNIVGIDEFLGRVSIPLSSFDVYERPRNRWYPLETKPGKENKKERGEIEVKIAFTVKAGSLTDLSKKEKHKSSLSQLSHAAQSVGGSLLSIGSLEKRKGIKKIARSIGSKINLKGKKKHESDDDSLSGSVGSLKRRVGGFAETKDTTSKQVRGDADPGVISEDEDEFTFDDLSHKSSNSSLNQNNTPLSATTVGITNSPSFENLDISEAPRRHTVHTVNTPPTKPPRLDVKQVDEWDLKLYGKSNKGLYTGSVDTLSRRTRDSPKLSSQPEEEEETVEVVVKDESNHKLPSKLEKSPKIGEEKENLLSKRLKYFKKDLKSETPNDKSPKSDRYIGERIIIGGENHSKVNSGNSRVSNELLEKFSDKSREDLILMACELQVDVETYKKKLKDMEDYLDDLLLRVMETTPRILQNPYINCKLAHTKLSG